MCRNSIGRNTKRIAIVTNRHFIHLIAAANIYDFYFDRACCLTAILVGCCYGIGGRGDWTDVYGCTYSISWLPGVSNCATAAACCCGYIGTIATVTIIDILATASVNGDGCRLDDGNRCCFSTTVFIYNGK
jgi:hypothetical protein